MGLLDQLRLLADKVVLLLVVLPFCGVISIVLLKRHGMDAARKTALINVSLSVLLALLMVGRFVPTGPVPAPVSQLVVSIPWLAADAGRTAGINLTFGVDGIGLWLAALVPLVVWCLLVTEWKQWDNPGQLGWLLAVEGCVLTVFLARDVVLLAAGFGAVAVVLPLALGAIGGEGRRAAARRLMLHQLAGSTLIMAGLAGTTVCHALMRGAPRAPPGAPAFDLDGLIGGIRELAALSPPAALVWAQFSPWLFLCTAAGCTLWAGAFPFHAPAAAACSRSSATGQVLITALAVKIGAYGLIRIALPLFPELCASIGMVLFLAAIWGSFVVACWLHAEDQPPRIMAGVAAIGSGVSLTGALSMTASGIRGGVLVLIGQVLSLTLYALVHSMLARRGSVRGAGRETATAVVTGSVEMPAGANRQGFREAPRLRAAWTFCRLNLAGVPGLAMFPGLLLVIMGLVDSARDFVGGWLIAVFVLWLVLALCAGAVLRTGPVTTDGHSPEPVRIDDLDAREVVGVLPLIVAILWLGLAPQLVLDRVDPAFTRLTPGLVSREAP